MLNRSMMILLSGAIGLTLTGCASSVPTTRAQSPEMMGMSYGGGYDCPPQGNACPGGQCDSQNCNLPCHPVHRNSYTVNEPKGLMYPPNPSPAGVTQYPYYTFRGPTDFFME